MRRSRSVRAEDARRARLLARRRLGPEYGLRAAMAITADYAKPGNPQAHWWNREKLGLWLPPLSADNFERSTGTLGVTRTCMISSACSIHRTGVRYLAVCDVNPSRSVDSLSQTGSGIGGISGTSHQSIRPSEYTMATLSI
jgi:hypothetical protein